MSKIFINWNEEIFNDPLKNKEIIEKIRSLNFEGSENLYFDDIAINYSINGIVDIIKYCNNIYKNGVEHLIVWASQTTQKLINSCLDFVLGKNNFHNENKIKLHFIDGYDKLTITKQKLDKYFKEDKNNKIAIIFLDGFIELNEGKINQMINLILSKFSEKSSDFLIKKMIYFIGKNEWFQHLKKHKIPNNNIFIVSSDINENYSFFSEISLIILATQGINIKKLVDGYKSNSTKVLNHDLYFNSALKLAFYLNQDISKSKNGKINALRNINLFVSYDSSLNISSNLFSHLYNPLTIKQNTFSDYAFFPTDISKIGQSVLSNKIPKLIIYLTFKQNNFDFQSSSIIDEDDLLSNFEHVTLNQIKNASLNAFNDYLLSFNEATDVLRIDFENQSEEVFGEFISILYWSKIFYGIINNINPFKIK
ncbi:hypothetical protein MCANUF31_00365 [Mycoplasmopsis canis UF31]|uniref:hypothetical protein n=1 Tax=Mycoplasmopsis canis TaxID=29555 RepID=UPI00025ADC14|nr:hypothetical protein [Mycoplasmopsis canis]EIE41062.1 hypothetical protein MCANUF31_00365 [Mycoplasmopsis canis UF31]